MYILQVSNKGFQSWSLTGFIKSGVRMKTKHRLFVPREELSAFCEQVALVQKSGIPLAEGIEMMHEGAQGRRIESLLAGLVTEMSGHIPLSDAMAKTGGFPAYLVQMTKIGERSGNLDHVMDGLADFYAKDADLRRKLRSALVYPAVLTIMMTAVIALIIIRVLPIFEEILTSFGGRMPTFSLVLLRFGIMVRNQWLLVSLVLIVAIVGLIFFWKSKAGRRIRDQFVLNGPVIGPLYQRIYAARFSQALAYLLRSGVDMDSALSMTEAIMDNQIVSDRISRLRIDVAGGQDLFTSLNTTRIFPRLFVRLLALGNRTGDLDGVMAKVAASYESEVDAQLTRFSGIVEPLLVVVLSVIVGGILLSVMLPLVEIISAVG
jgi:type IV pilus assembly protein PilC